MRSIEYMWNERLLVLLGKESCGIKSIITSMEGEHDHAKAFYKKKSADNVTGRGHRPSFLLLNCSVFEVLTSLKLALVQSWVAWVRCCRQKTRLQPLQVNGRKSGQTTSNGGDRAFLKHGHTKSDDTSGEVGKVV